MRLVFTGRATVGGLCHLNGTTDPSFVFGKVHFTKKKKNIFTCSIYLYLIAPALEVRVILVFCSAWGEGQARARDAISETLAALYSHSSAHRHEDGARLLVYSTNLLHTPFLIASRGSINLPGINLHVC